MDDHRHPTSHWKAMEKKGKARLDTGARDAVRWVFQNLGVADAVDKNAPPCPLAADLWHLYSGTPESRREFYEQFGARFLGSAADVKKETSVGERGDEPERACAALAHIAD